jgi:hypothetical protein
MLVRIQILFQAFLINPAQVTLTRCVCNRHSGMQERLALLLKQRRLQQELVKAVLQVLFFLRAFTITFVVTGCLKATDKACCLEHTHR